MCKTMGSFQVCRGFFGWRTTRPVPYALRCQDIPEKALEIEAKQILHCPITLPALECPCGGVPAALQSRLVTLPSLFF